VYVTVFELHYMRETMDELKHKTSDFPEWVVPMAATLTQERFTAPEWVFERKLDGIRLLAFKNGTEVKLYSRNRLPQNYTNVAEAIVGCL
jgi:ATP-dependent DNA ligase